MNCRQTGTHVVKAGDSLYTIAMMHKMMMPEIMEMNPGLDPYNLQIGSTVVICRDREMAMTPGQGGSADQEMRRAMDLNNRMRLAWNQHAYLSRMLMVSILDGLGDLDVVTQRALRNPADMGAVLAEVYPAEAVNQVVGLLTEHAQLLGDLIRSWSQGDMANANELNRRWYMNANQLAEALAALNPFYYDVEELRTMLYRHLELLKDMIAKRMAGDYAGEMMAYEEMEKEAMRMADYLTAGMLGQSSHH